MAQIQKQVTKPVVKAAAKTKAAVAPKSIKLFALNNRPVSQGRLFAHTHAALTFFGLFGKGNTAPRKAVEHVMGLRAVGNHLYLKNMVADKGRIALTDHGATFFGMRPMVAGFDKTLSAAYLAAIKSGKVNEALGVREQNLVPLTVYL